MTNDNVLTGDTTVSGQQAEEEKDVNQLILDELQKLNMTIRWIGIHLMLIMLLVTIILMFLAFRLN